MLPESNPQWPHIRKHQQKARCKGPRPLDLGDLRDPPLTLSLRQWAPPGVWPDSLGPSHWPGRTQLLPIGHAAGSGSTWALPLPCHPVPGIPPFVLVPGSELPFLSWRCPRAEAAALPRLAGVPPSDVATVACPGLLLPVPGTQARPGCRLPAPPQVRPEPRTARTPEAAAGLAPPRVPCGPLSEPCCPTPLLWVLMRP